MSNYRRFITYLFRYENGEKMEQCGYARVEQRQNLGKIEFNIKNCGTSGGEILPCFFAEAGQVRIPIGPLAVKGQTAEGTFRFVCDAMGDTEYGFEDMRGLVIPLTGVKNVRNQALAEGYVEAEGRQMPKETVQLILSQWDDEPCEWEVLAGWTGNPVKDVSRREDEPELENTQSDEDYIVTKTLKVSPDRTKNSPSEAKNKISQSKAEYEKLSAKEEKLDLKNDHPLVEESFSTERISAQQLGHPLKKILDIHQKFYPFESDCSVWAVKAQLRDIEFLPRDCWHLGNNSFVLRGYFNYGSLLIGYMEQEQAFFLGVPGVFRRQEKVIASLFGFDSFRGKVSATEKPGDFGYWYKLLDVVI